MILRPFEAGPISPPRRPAASEWFEPAVPLLLSAVGVLSVVASHSGPVAMTLVAAVGVSGLLGLLGWRGQPALVLRASLIAGVAFGLPLADAALVPHVLQWWYAVIAVYPMLLRLRAAVVLSTVLATALLTQFPLGLAVPQSTVWGWTLRAMVLLAIGLIVARAGQAYRDAVADAEHRRTLAEHAERELQHATSHDPLTGMPNRSSLELLIDIALHERSGSAHDQVGLLLVDLDRFKNVNETLGHLAGDLLLREVAERLTAALQPGQRIARLGGDEFAIVCGGVTLAQAEAAGHRLVTLFASPVELGGAPYRISLSAGVAVSGHGLEARSDLLRCADAAMYAAKRAGRGQCMAFDRTMSEDVAANLAVEQQLRNAIALGAGMPTHPHAITAVFQPVVRLATGQVVAAEALARWELDGRPVSPLRFVPLAEELGLGHDLAIAIVRQSLAALASWRRDGLTEVQSIAVNISASDLLAPGLANELATLVAHAGLEPGTLTLEITERDVVDDVERTREALQELRAKGITVAVDDFGTGFSSLAYLARLPLHVLKIDREFVANLELDDTIARTVVQLAGSFGMECIAEGIETPEQLGALSDLGVQAGQGWHLGRPARAADFVRDVRRQVSSRS